MTTIKEILKKYKIKEELPQKFEEIQLVKNSTDIKEYHKETHNNNTIHIFTDKPDDRGITTEYIIDPKNYKLTILSKKNGEEIFGTYEEYKYIKSEDNIQITHT